MCKKEVEFIFSTKSDWEMLSLSWVQIPTLPLSSFVTPGTLSNLSGRRHTYL